jgi:hypothetical protein
MSNYNLTGKPCPYVACGSTDAFSYHTLDMVGKCFSCKTGYPNRAAKFDWAEEKYPLKERKPPVAQREVAKSTYEGIRGIDPDLCQL